ncbi:MAG: ABC transporter substrate-binding protein [Pseudomonadota bacterium]
MSIRSKTRTARNRMAGAGLGRRGVLKGAAGLSVLWAAGPAVIGRAGAQAAPEVKIGFLLPLTGGFAEVGQLHKQAVDMAVEEINAAGGVKSLGGAKVVALYGNSSSVDEANTETQRLIAREKVHGIIGAYSSGATISSSVIAERASVPYLVPNALADEITARGLKFVFKSVPHFSQFAINSGELVRDLSTARGQQVSTCCLVRENNFFGNVVGREFAKHMPSFNIKVLADNIFPSNPTSFEDVILKLKQDGPDVVFAAGEPSSITLLFQQLNELKYWPKLGWIGAGGGYSNPVTWNNLGKLATGLIVVNDWFPEIKRPGAAQVNAKFKARTGVDMLGNANTTYAGVQIFHGALEKAASLEGDKIRAALAALDMTSGGPMFMYERVSFDPTGFMPYAKLVAAQVRDGQARVIWPESLKVADALWPVPDWSRRT